MGLDGFGFRNRNRRFGSSVGGSVEGSIGGRGFEIVVSRLRQCCARDHARGLFEVFTAPPPFFAALARRRASVASSVERKPLLFLLLSLAPIRLIVRVLE